MYNLNDICQDVVSKILVELTNDNIIARINQKDYTLWNNNKTIQKERLGWLDSPTKMLDNILLFDYMSHNIKLENYNNIIVIGMGGSSLGSKVIYEMIGKQENYPNLLVFDSTIPSDIVDITNKINIKQTLFIICSKSGETIETNTLYRYFRNIANDQIGESKAGQNFIAITDKDSKLEKLALKENFSKIFINDSTIGGRYSVLSYFGLIPASIAGIDIKLLLENTTESIQYNHGVLSGTVLGAVLGAMVRLGRNKCYMLCTEKTRPLAQWIEQLLAESTGQNGTGIIPIIDQINCEISNKTDRFYIILKYDNEINDNIDAIISRIQYQDDPAIFINLNEPYNIGTEFYRWEYAIAVASYVMGIDPFDEPDVQLSKHNTKNILNEYIENKNLPLLENDSIDELQKLLLDKKEVDYLAINSYLYNNNNTKYALSKLQEYIIKKYNIPTIVEFGPRYLHSTGQLHKGGPENVIILQLVQNHNIDVEIPDCDYGFGTLTNVQSIGDVLALRQLNRRVVFYNLYDSVVDGIYSIMHEL